MTSLPVPADADPEAPGFIKGRKNVESGWVVYTSTDAKKLEHIWRFVRSTYDDDFYHARLNTEAWTTRPVKFSVRSHPFVLADHDVQVLSSDLDKKVYSGAIGDTFNNLLKDAADAVVAGEDPEKAVKKASAEFQRLIDSGRPFGFIEHERKVRGGND
jgi:hypothetical protein